jgi:hypothetical protein
VGSPLPLLRSAFLDPPLELSGINTDAAANAEARDLAALQLQVAGLPSEAKTTRHVADLQRLSRFDLFHIFVYRPANFAETLAA